MNITDKVERMFLDYESLRITSGRPSLFLVYPQHIELLKRLYIHWHYDNSGIQSFLAGAPTVNLRRPYGNSGIEADVAEICGIPVPDWDDEENWDEETFTRLALLHRSMAIVLEIAVQCNGVTPGAYISQWPGPWQKIDDPTQGEPNNAVLLHP